MKSTITLITIFLLTLSTQSCTTRKLLSVNSHFNNYYINKSENQIINTLGEPDRKQTIQTGERIFVYESDRAIDKAFRNELNMNNYAAPRGKKGYMEFKLSDHRVTYAETNVLCMGRVFSPGKTVGLAVPLAILGAIVIAASSN